MTFMKLIICLIAINASKAFAPSRAIASSRFISFRVNDSNLGQDISRKGEDLVNQGKSAGKDAANKGEDLLNQGKSAGQDAFNKAKEGGNEAAHKGEDLVNQGKAAGESAC